MNTTRWQRAVSLLLCLLMAMSFFIVTAPKAYAAEPEWPHLTSVGTPTNDSATKPFFIANELREDFTFTLGQFTRNYTQTTKRGLLTTKQAEHQAQESARCSACFVVRGFQRGLPLGTRLCLQSVVCYTLCRRCRENTVAAGESKGI